MSPKTSSPKRLAANNRASKSVQGDSDSDVEERSFYIQNVDSSLLDDEAIARLGERDNSGNNRDDSGNNSGSKGTNNDDSGSNKLPTVHTVTGGELKVTKIKTPLKKRDSLRDSLETEDSLEAEWTEDSKKIFFGGKEKKEKKSENGKEKKDHHGKDQGKEKKEKKTEETDLLECEFLVEDYDILKFRKDFMSQKSDWAIWKADSPLFAEAVAAGQTWASEKNHKAYKKEFVDEFERSVFDDSSRNAKNDSSPPAKQKRSQSSLPRNCFSEHDPRTCFFLEMDENDGMPLEVHTAIQENRDLIPAIFLSVISRVFVSVKFTTTIGSTEERQITIGSTEQQQIETGTQQRQKVGTNKSSTKVGTNKSTKVGTNTKVGTGNKMKLERVMQIRQSAVTWGGIGKKDWPVKFSQTIEGEEIEEHGKTSLKIKFTAKMEEIHENMENKFPIYAWAKARGPMLQVWKDAVNAMISHLKGEQ